jgi:pimeloyl-ACP methyl ester carboxylesterase
MCCAAVTRQSVNQKRIGAQVARAGIAVSRVRAGCQLCGPLAQNESGAVERQPGEDRRLRQFERCDVAELLAMRPRDSRYNAIPLREAPRADASVAYVAMRSPISNTFARYQNAEKLKRSAMIRNNTTFFVPWDTIHESNPQEILDRHETITKVPFLIMQGALDDNVLPAVQERFAQTYRDAGGDIQYQLFEGCEHEWVAQPGPQTDHAREMVRAFIARQVNAS